MRKLRKINRNLFLAKQELKEWLIKYTGCNIHSDGFPCNTCTIDLFKRLGMSQIVAEETNIAIKDIRSIEDKAN